MGYGTDNDRKDVVFAGSEVGTLIAKEYPITGDGYLAPVAIIHVRQRAFSGGSKGLRFRGRPGIIHGPNVPATCVGTPQVHSMWIFKITAFRTLWCV